MSNKYRKGIAMYQTILRLALVKQRTGLSRSSIDIQRSQRSMKTRGRFQLTKSPVAGILPKKPVVIAAPDR